MKKKFQTPTSRVKGLSFHPSRPWVIASLHSGDIQIWDYNIKILIAKFDDHEGPVRGIQFHPHLPLFVSGGDDSDVRVWNYKQKRCTFVLKGHIDWIRTVNFHNQLPWILSSSDDQTVRIWNYQSRSCINIITGHSHYVMCAQFHPQKNYIVSCSLDSTVRIWDFSILRKKLTQTKNASSFIGIQIECIKILEGHERGANWVSFHPSQNIIASGSDDRKIKLWKYTNEVAWEHSTIVGHKSNISALAFDPVTGNLITNSEDKTIRIWNIESKNEITVEKRNKSRYWILAVKPNGSMIAAGHDEGFEIFHLNKERVPYALVTSNFLIFAQGLITYLYDIPSKKEKKELSQYALKDKNSFAFIDKIITNPFESNIFMVQVNEDNRNYYMIKKKESYLNFPNKMNTYEGLDSIFVSGKVVATLVSALEIKFTSLSGEGTVFKDIKLKDKSHPIKNIFNTSKENELLFITDTTVNKYNIKERKLESQESLEKDMVVKSIVFGPNNCIAIVSKFLIMVTSEELERTVTIKEKFPIRSAFWESEKILFYTTHNHWKFAFMNGETGVLKTIEEPLHLIKKLPNNKFLAFSERQKMFEVECQQYHEVQLKLALNEKDEEKVKEILSKIELSDKKILIKYLVEKGYAAMALNLVKKPEEKFALAIQSSDFQLALKICTEHNTQEYWKMLGEEALKQGIYEAYHLSCRKLKNFNELNFLFSLQHNQDELRKMSTSIAKKINDPILGFNASLFLNDREQMEETLREGGLSNLAELCQQTGNEDAEKSDILKRLKSRPLTLVQPFDEEQNNTANWEHNVQEDQEEEDEEDDD